MNVDGYVSSGGLGGPAILPLSLAKMSQLTQAFPDKAFSGIGGIAEFAHALTTSCSAAARCRSARRRCSIMRLDRTSSRQLIAGLNGFLERHEADGWTSVESFRGIRRDRVVAHSKIRRPDEKDYRGGFDAEGYADAEIAAAAAEKVEARR